MKQKGKHKLRNIIFAVLLLSATVPVAVFGTWMIQRNSERINIVMHDDLTMLSENQVNNVKSFCDGRKENMDMLAQLSIVKEAIWASLSMRHMDVRYLDNMLKEQKQSKDYLVSVSIIDKNFKVVSSTAEASRGDYSTLKDTNADFRGGNFRISGVRTRTTDEGEISAVVAITGVFSGNKLIGYVVEELATQYFDSMRTNALVAEHGFVHIIDGDGNIISSGKAISGEGDLKEEDSFYGFREVWDSIDRVAAPSGEFEYTSDGIDYIASYSDIEYTDWNVIMCMDAGFYYSSISDFRILVAFVMAAIFIAMMIIEFYITKLMLAPIHKIVDTLVKVQKDHDYSVRINYQGNTELGYVTNQLDAMLSILEKDFAREEEIRQNLEELADSDALTGINNKRSFESLLDKELENVINRKSRIAIGFLDIDDFRNFNTMYGHRVGDQVIRFVASTLEKLIDGEVGRMGGDEFVFFISNESTIDVISDVLNEFLDMMQAGIGLRDKGTRAVVTCSVGVVIAQGDDLDRATLIEKADEAMYVAKDHGKNTYHIV